MRTSRCVLAVAAVIFLVSGCSTTPATTATTSTTSAVAVPLPTLGTPQDPSVCQENHKLSAGAVCMPWAQPQARPFHEIVSLINEGTKYGSWGALYACSIPSQALLTQITGSSQYRKAIDRFICNIFTGTSIIDGTIIQINFGQAHSWSDWTTDHGQGLKKENRTVSGRRAVATITTPNSTFADADLVVEIPQTPQYVWVIKVQETPSQSPTEKDSDGEPKQIPPDSAATWKAANDIAAALVAYDQT